MKREDKSKYRGNPNLKGTDVEIEYTSEQVKEYIKCSQDPLYFMSHYVKIVHVDRGLIQFEPYGYQIRMTEACLDNRFVICKIPRQYGKSTVVAALLLWYVLFNKHFKIALLAHKADQAQELLGRIKLAFEFLPKWLQQGIVKWNEGDIIFENGSLIQAEATSAGSIRGRSYNIVYMDELAHVSINEQEDFFTSTFPTITSGQTTKLIITSTPKGMEMFYRIWTDSEKGKNDYVRVEAFWHDLPNRDEAWKETMIRATSDRQFDQEFNCSFLGSMSTLIDGHKLGQIPTEYPVSKRENDCLAIWKDPVKGHQYVCCVDTSHGVELDYSCFVIIDVSQIPYEVVARYRSNVIPSIFYPEVIYRACRYYNDAFCLAEANDQGHHVINTLYMDLEYEHIFISQSKGAKGQQIGGFGQISNQLGLKMTPATKRIGCSAIKTIIEMDRLIINDFDILHEATTFVADKKKSYSAEPGKNDDLMMTLVMFGWLVHQPYFKELTNIDIRRDLLDDNTQLVEQSITPFGYIDNGRALIADEDDFWKGF